MPQPDDSLPNSSPEDPTPLADAAGIAPLARQYGKMSQIGFEFVGPMLIGLFLDFQFGWLPWGTVAGALLGLVVGMVHLFSLTFRDSRKALKR